MKFKSNLKSNAKELYFFNIKEHKITFCITYLLVNEYIISFLLTVVEKQLIYFDINAHSFDKQSIANKWCSSKKDTPQQIKRTEICNIYIIRKNKPTGTSHSFESFILLPSF